MPTYKAPVDDVMFLLGDVFHIERYNNLPGFADASPDLVEAVLAEAAKFCEDVLTPLNRVGDKEGCRRLDDGSVTTPTGFKDAYRRLIEGGWVVGYNGTSHEVWEEGNVVFEDDRVIHAGGAYTGAVDARLSARGKLV